jgi:hypothetical protein
MIALKAGLRASKHGHPRGARSVADALSFDSAGNAETKISRRWNISGGLPANVSQGEALDEQVASGKRDNFAP